MAETDHGKSWQLWMGLANVLACLAVIFLHFNCFWDGPGQGRSFLSATVIETCFDWAVPVFLMLSGANLIDYRRRMDTRTYARKRIVKTVLPYLAWSFIALAYGIMAHTPATADLSPLAVVNGIITNRYCAVYWFFQPLFAMYLCIPFFSLMDHRDEAFKWLAVMAFIVDSLIPTVSHVTSIAVNDSLLPPIVEGQLLYLFLGHVICNTDMLDKKRRVVTVLAVACLLVKMVLIYETTMHAGKIDRVYTDGLGPFNVVIATAVLLNLKLMNLQRFGSSSRLYQWTRWLTGRTFGVYLIHYFIRDVLLRTMPTTVLHSICYRTFGAVAVFAVCIALVAILQKVPLLRRILPG